MRASEIIELEVFKIWRDQISKFADIRIRHREIIWMNTNIATSGVRPLGESSSGEFPQDLNIEDISPNLIDDFEGKISHKINLKSPYDKENLYVFITDKQLIELGFKEKPPIIKFKLNENKRWFIELIVIILIGVGNWYFDFLPTKEKQSDDKHTDTPQIQDQKKQPLQDIREESHQFVPIDSTNISKYDSLHLDLKD